MNSPVFRLLALAAAILAMVLTAGDAPGAVAWRDVTNHGPSGRTGHAMAYDSHRDRVVMFGGRASLAGQTYTASETWEWDGTDWELVITTGPPGVWRGSMAYDSERQRIVLFGGETDTGLSDGTWEWDGADWTEVSTSGPPARSGHDMVYDSARQRTVLFGGLDATDSRLSDTWEWDGDDWEQVATTGPSPRNLHAMAYDHARGVAVLFGGAEDGQSGSGETWEWDGDEWELAATTGPTARSSHAMAYDPVRGVTVLQGGTSGGSDTWEWNGSSWQERNVNPPDGAAGHRLVFDTARGHVVRFGGVIPRSLRFLPFATTWTYSGSAWEKVATSDPTPGRHKAAMAWDDARGNALMFGGEISSTLIGETWTWDGRFWERRPAGISPPARAGAAMAYDPVRERIVLFGGEGEAGVLFGDTWEWDGDSWTEMTPPVHPSARTGHQMAWDGNSQAILMFGGSAGMAVAEGTWKWDGSEWTQPAVSPSPTARVGHVMAWDAANQQVVLHGGVTGLAPGITSDLWVWDGSSWEVGPGSGTLGRAGHTMVHNSRAGVMQVFGGQGDTGFSDETWSWDGQEWIQHQTTIAPLRRLRHTMTYDPYHDQLMIHGGLTPQITRKAAGLDGGGQDRPQATAEPADVVTPVYTVLMDTWVLGFPYTVPPGAREGGDFNNDGCVDFQDFIFLLDNWGEEIDGTPIGFSDFIALLDNWGEGC